MLLCLLLAAWLLNQHMNKQELNYCIYFFPYTIYVLLFLLLCVCVSIPLTLLLHVCFVTLFDFYCFCMYVCADFVAGI